MACKKNGKKDTVQKYDMIKTVAVIGEPKCGKTSLIMSFSNRHLFCRTYFNNGVWVYPCRFGTEGRRVALFEIPSTPDFSFEQRVLLYYQADAIIFMYAIDNPASLEMLRQVWIPEVNLFIQEQRKPVLFVGNKKDLRNDREVVERLASADLTPVTFRQSLELLEYYPLACVIECCANYPADVDTVFEAVLVLLNPQSM